MLGGLQADPSSEVVRAKREKGRKSGSEIHALMSARHEPGPEIHNLNPAAVNMMHGAT